MTSNAVCTPPVMARDALTRAARMAVPPEPQRKVGGVGELQRAYDSELLDVDVDLEQAGEQHQTVGAGRVDLQSEVREGGKER